MILNRRVASCFPRRDLLSCRYFPEASSINFGRSVKYGVGVLKTSPSTASTTWGFGEASFLIDDPALRLDLAGPGLL